MRVGITIRFINSYFSGSLPQQGLAIGKALALAGHEVTYLYPKGEPAWFIDVESIKGEFTREVWQNSSGFDIVIEVGWAIPPSERKGRVVSFVHCPPIFYDMESSVYPWNPAQRSFQNLSAILTYDHYSQQDVRYLEFLSGVKVFQVPYIWNPDTLDAFVKENSLPTWSESAERVGKLIPAGSSPVSSWCARIVESNFSNSSHCIMPLNIVSQIRTRGFPIRFTVHNGDQTSKSDFFNNNIVKNLVLPDISGNMVPRVRLPDLIRDKTVLIAHQRFRPIKSYLIDACYLGIPLIHNCEMLRKLDLGYYYELNQIHEAADCFAKMTKDHEEHKGFFDPLAANARKALLRTTFSYTANSAKYGERLLEIANLPLQVKQDIQPFYHSFASNNVLRVAFCEMWADFQPKYNFFMYLFSWLGKLHNVSVELDNVHPNLVLYGPFSNGGEHKYPGVPKVFFTGENSGPSLNADTFLNMGYRYDMGDAYIRLPLWVLEINWWGANPDCIKNPKPVGLSECLTVKPELLDKKKHFCAFVATNPCNPTRNDVFQILNRWRPVHSAGRLFCNRAEGPLACGLGGGGGELSKIDYYKDFQFALTFENSSSPGYTTEKLFHAKVAGCVPIYWGDAFVDRDFASSGFINANQMGSAHGLIDLVSKVVNNPDEWRKMASVPALSASKKQWCERTIESIGKAIFKKILGKDIQLTEKDWENATSFGQEYETNESNETMTKPLMQTPGASTNIFITAANSKFVEAAINLLVSFSTTNTSVRKIVYIWPDVTQEMIQALEKHGANEIRKMPCTHPSETPWHDFWDPQHFAWKLWVLNHAAKSAHSGANVVYIDAGVVITKQIDEIWNTIDRHGAFLLNDPREKNERWCHPTFCKSLHVTQDELRQNQLWAGCIGFKKGGVFDSVISNAIDIAKQREIIVGKKWEPYSSVCMGHRHDQSILSILTSRLGLQRVPLDTFYCDTSMRAAQYLGAALYVHRGSYRELVPFVDKIDEVYVINLSRREDRKKKFMESHSNICDRVYVWKGIDGRQLPLNADLFQLFRNNDFSWKKAVMGCALSHYGLWQKLATDTIAKSYLILEDDVVLQDRWLIQWAQACSSFPSDADVVYLGGVLPPNKAAFPTIIDSVNPYFAKVKPNSIFGGSLRRYFHFCNYAYILTKQGAQKLCNVIKERGIFTSGDHMIVNHGDTLLNIYFTTPLLATCYQENDPAYQTSQFNNFSRIDNFDSDLWNNDERFQPNQLAAFASPAKDLTVSTTMTHEERVQIWNAFLRHVSRNEREHIAKSIDAIFAIWESLSFEEFQINLGWFRVFEQLVTTKNSALLEYSNQIRNRIAGLDCNIPSSVWGKILETLPMSPSSSERMTIFHIHEVDPTHCLESDWLQSIFPKPICWAKLDSTKLLSESSCPILFYNNIPGRSGFVKERFTSILKEMEEANVHITLLHLSDEFGTDDLEMYTSKAVKQVIRTYWRTDLPLYGEKVYVIPLGYTNGRGNSRPGLPTYSQRHNVWSFAGSMDRPGRATSLATLRTVAPFTEFAKTNWGSPNLVEATEYKEMLECSKFVPCFKGTKSLESFRFYEALESGAIPIYVPSESSMSKDEYRELFGQHPFLGFPTWERAVEVLPKLVSQTDIMEKHRVALSEWWLAKKTAVRTKIHSMFTAKSSN